MTIGDKWQYCAVCGFSTRRRVIGHCEEEILIPCCSECSDHLTHNKEIEIKYKGYLWTIIETCDWEGTI